MTLTTTQVSSRERETRHLFPFRVILKHTVDANAALWIDYLKDAPLLREHVLEGSVVANVHKVCIFWSCDCSDTDESP